MQREANAPSGAPMKKPSGIIMVSAFALTNEVLHQAANKPPTSASMCTTSDNDDEVMIVIYGRRVGNAIIGPFFRTTCKFLFYSIYKCFSNICGDYHFCKCFERNVCNRGFGIEIHIPLLSFKKILFLINFMFIP